MSEGEVVRKGGRKGERERVRERVSELAWEMHGSCFKLGVTMYHTVYSSWGSPCTTQCI